MEKKQFAFTGLTWMKPEQIQTIRKQLLSLEDYGIEFEIVMHHDTRIFISDYDDILQNPDDESAIVFIKKFDNTFEQSSDGKTKTQEEDCLLIIKIDDDMNIKAKLLTYRGDIQELQFNGERFIN